MTLTVGSLFSGIGGLELGLERAGMRVLWQVEKDPFCRRVLEKHWPGVRRHDDVTTFPPRDGADWRCDLVCGGFPCQDLSYAGSMAGIEGKRSGLWRELLRIVRLVQPRYVLLENVPALLDRGLGVVLAEMAAMGLDAEWCCLPAAAFGSPQLRDRVFVLAYPQRDGLCRHTVAAESIALGGTASQAPRQRAEKATVIVHRHQGVPARPDPGLPGRDDSPDHGRSPFSPILGRWLPEPAVGRVADGLPTELDQSRLRAIGNAVVPQVAEWVGRRILEFHCCLEKGGAA